MIMIRNRRAALLASLSIAAIALPAHAQDAPANDQTGAAPMPGLPQGELTGTNEPETIIVTGTRSTSRTLATSPVPVDVLSAETLSRSGFTETNRVLAEQVPSFNFPQPSIADGTDVVRPATLRGLNPDQTLVLINGKRRHTSALLNINGSVGRGSAAVDINLIPSIALKRVEVLRDGAAAQYGSDAIAGVINFGLRDAREGGRITVTYGQYETRVDGIERVTGLQTGANGQPLLAPDGTFLVNTNGKDRRASDGRTVTVAGTVGLPIGQDGYFDVSAEYSDRNPTNRTGYDRRRQYNLVAGAVDPRELTINRLTHRYGDADTKDMKLFVNSAVPLGESGFQLYGFGSYNYRDGESAGFYRLANDTRNIPAVYPNGFLPLINTDTDDYAGTGGVRGEVGGFKVDLSGGYSRNKIKFLISNTLNASYGASSQRAFDAGDLTYSQAIANLDVNRELSVGWLKSLTIAGGLEYRRETFEITPGEPTSYNSGGVLVSANQPGGANTVAAPGAQVFSGFQPVIGGQRVDGQRARHNVSAYAEIDADVSDAFSLQFAGRYEDYSDFGSSWNGKAAARFELVDGFAVRGAVSTGFRAPSLQQQFYAAAATNNVNGLLLDTVTLPVDNPVAIALGARPLDAEKSLSYAAGVIFTAVPRLNITVDVYQVDIDDRIVVTDNLTASRNAAGQPSGTDPGASIAQILNNAGFNSIAAARFFVNGLDSRTRGIDAVGTYRIDLGGAGRVNLTAGMNYNKTTIRQLLASPGPLANVPNLVLFGRQEQGRLTRGQPRTKINLGLDYDYDVVGLTLRANRYGKVEATGGSIGTGVFNDNFLQSQWVTDLEVRANLGEQLELAVGANNLFDTYPTLVPTGLAGTTPAGASVYFPTTNFVAPYSNYSPAGFNGRFLYGRVSFKF
jgi:iron complex outermembrane receptor protein